MPEIGVTTGNPNSPRLKLFDAEAGDFDSMLMFSGGLFRLWVRSKKDAQTNKWTEMARYDLKVTASEANGEIKIANTEKVSEQKFTTPTLPPPDPADGLYQVYYSTYDVVIPLPPGYHACYETAKQFGKLALRDNLLTSLDLNQIVEGTPTPNTKLFDYLKKNHAFKTTAQDRRAKFTKRTLAQQTVAEVTTCQLGPEEEGKVAIAGMGLTEQDNASEYTVYDAVVAVY